MSSASNFFTDKAHFSIIDTRRLTFLAATVLAFFGTEFGRFVYRPFIYQNNINDFGLADSVGNWGGIVVQIFFGMTILNPPYKKGFRLIGFFVAGYILYEALQPILPKGTFDWLDIYGTLVGGVIGIIVYVFINKLVQKNKTIYRFS
jgi:hypothetical protein